MRRYQKYVTRGAGSEKAQIRNGHDKRHSYLCDAVNTLARIELALSSGPTESRSDRELSQSFARR